MSTTIFIIIITAITSFLAFRDESIFNKMKFNPYMVLHRKEWYRFLSYSLLHADWGHLLINMFVLYSFGSLVEEIFKHYFESNSLLYFLLLYIGGVVFSVIFSFVRHKHNHWYNAVGASGAVSAVLFSSIIMYPQGEIILLLLPIPIPAFIFGILYLAYSAYMAKKAKDNVGHDAHFWGAVYGILFTIALRPAFFSEFFLKIFN
ncbi:MAG: rhomboid family intramembrane serine protease [Bacteroidota bacterium]